MTKKKARPLNGSTIGVLLILPRHKARISPGMDIEFLRSYCMAKPGVTEEFPFDESTLVFKVMGKIFLLLPLDELTLQFNVKCEPSLAIELREQYSCVSPGYHMSKKMWNTIKPDGTVDDRTLLEWIDHSYQEVVKGLTKKLQVALNQLDQDS